MATHRCRRVPRTFKPNIVRATAKTKTTIQKLAENGPYCLSVARMACVRIGESVAFVGVASDHGALLLPEVGVRGLVVGGDHVGGVPSRHRRRRALHDHQADGGLGGGGVGGVLLGGVFAAAVVHDAGDEEDEQQDDVAGDEDAQVQRDRVDLLVVLQKAHGAPLMLGGP